MLRTRRIVLVVGAAVVGALYAWGHSPVRPQADPPVHARSFHSVATLTGETHRVA